MSIHIAKVEVSRLFMKIICIIMLNKMFIFLTVSLRSVQGCPQSCSEDVAVKYNFPDLRERLKIFTYICIRKILII
jgi:hypothetical protein